MYKILKAPKTDEMEYFLKEIKTNYQTLLLEWSALQEDLKNKIVNKIADNEQTLHDRPNEACEFTHGNPTLHACCAHTANRQVCTLLVWPDEAKGLVSLLTVNKEDLAQLATEITQLKNTLPAVLNQSKMANIGRVEALEEEALQLQKEKSEVESQVLYWKSRCQSAFAECQREKEENLKLRCDLQELTNQMSQQSEYCTSLGSACCTILWRVSRNEDSVQAILMGSKVDEFLSLISSTLTSFCEAYKTDWPKEESHETQFILALCGIITNVAASAYGRDFLVNNQHGCQILDTHINVLSSMPISKCAQLKNLILMCLFNISINQKGIKYLSAKQGLMGLLAWLLQGEINNDVRANTLRLIQSLLYDDTNISILHSLEEVLPLTALQDLGRDGNKEIRELALELISDIRHFQKEP